MNDEDRADSMTIVFQPEGRKVHVPKGTTVLRAALEAGVGVEGPCGGQGTCGKCKVKLLLPSGRELPSPNVLERKALDEEELEDDLRLACQVPISFDCTVEVPRDSQMYKHLILMTGLDSATVPVPNVTVNTITGEEGVETVVYLGEKPVLRRKGEYLDVYGVAVDLGTTTVVCHLVNLRSGAVEASSVDLNPQIARGDDVITRIRVAQGEEGARWLTAKAREVVNDLISDVCDEAGISFQEIFEMVLVGNTCMHHLFYGLSVEGLGQSPYMPAHTGPIYKNPEEIGIDINPVGQILSPPVLAGFLGADATAVALSAALDCYEGTRMAVDIGTNGEILLCTEGSIYGCSSPAGPAFEGAQISCGMRASNGAITYFRMEDDGTKYSVVGSSKPRGIAGSGLVDVVASLLENDLMDRSGRLASDHESSHIRGGEKGPEFVVAGGDDTYHGRDIVVTQKDIRQLQLAKGAIAAGISILLSEASLSTDDLDDIYVAGAFGNYIDRRSAMAIGLLPEMDPRHIVSIGNGAVIGAKRTLVSLRERARAETIMNRLNYIEVAGREDFQDIFMTHIHF